jgi:hypothetical protein
MKWRLRCASRLIDGKPSAVRRLFARHEISFKKPL